MAELYAKPYEVIDTGYNPQQTQQGGQDAEMQAYLESLPPEERQKAIERINAPLTGEEMALMASSGQRMPTLEDFAEIEKYHKNHEVSFIDGLGKIAEGGEQVMTDLSNAFASFLSDPKDATSKMPATAVEAFAQGTRNFYGMLAQSSNPDSSLFRVKDFLNGTGTIEDRYNQYIEALKFNRDSVELMEGKRTMVMDKDMINHEVTQAMAYIADPTLFIPFGKVASTGLRAVGLGEKLTMAGARAAAIKNGIIGNTIKWGAGQPLEFMGGAVRNTIDYGLEKAGAAFEATTGISGKEFAQTARMSGVGFSASGVAGYAVPYASTISDAYLVGSSARGFGEALTLLGDTMAKNKFGRGINSWAAEALDQAQKNGIALSPHAKGLLKTLNAVDPLFAYGWNGLETAAEGSLIGGGLGYLSGGEEGMYSGIGAGIALGAVGGTAGKMVADVTGGTNVARRAVQAKMVIEGHKVTNPEKAMFFQAMQKAAEVRGKDVDLVNGIIAGIDNVAPNFEFHALTPDQFEAEAKKRGYNPDTGKFMETSALDVEFGGDRASKSKAMYVLRSIGGDFVGNRQAFLDALKGASSKDSANIPSNLKKYIDVAKTFEKLSKTQQEAILKEIDGQAGIANELGGTTKLREHYDALSWSEAWTDLLVKKFESDREGARKDIIDMLAQETNKKGELTRKGRALADKLRAEGFLDKDNKLLRERNLLNADLTLSQFRYSKGAVIGREADGKTHMYINLKRMGDETFPHELFHTIMRESPMKKHFTDTLIHKLIGTVDKDGNLVRPAEVNLEQVTKFFKKYIDLTHRNDDGTLNAKASEEKFKQVQEALAEYQNAGENKKISDKARSLIENYTEEFGAYYFSHWLMGRNRNTLFFGGELKGIEGLVERAKDSFKDFWQSKISKSNPEFDFSRGLNEAFDRSKGLGRIGAMDYFMRDMVRAASNANKEVFRPDSMTLENLRDFERSNGLRNLTTPEGTRRLNPREQVTQNIRLGKEAHKILSGLDKNLRTSKDVLDEDGKQIITGRLSEAELDALVKGGIVPRAWADKVNQGYAMLDGTVSNIFSAGYLGRTEQTTDASYPRLTGKDVSFKNRKAVLFDVETKIKADGTFYTLFHTLDLAVIEQRGNHLWQNVDYRNLWNGDRAAFEADFFRYISNASKASTDPKKLDSATLFETGDGNGAKRRDVMHQMAGMALQTGDAYKHQPIAVIPEGIRHSVTTFNIDGMTMPRVETGTRYDINMGNAHKFIRENWQPAEMKQEKTPAGTLFTHETGFKFSAINGKYSAYTNDGSKIGTYGTIREATFAAKNLYNKAQENITKIANDFKQKEEQNRKNLQPLDEATYEEAFRIGDMFKTKRMQEIIGDSKLVRQTFDEFRDQKVEEIISGKNEQEKGAILNQLFSSEFKELIDLEAELKKTYDEFGLEASQLQAQETEITKKIVELGREKIRLQESGNPEAKVDIGILDMYGRIYKRKQEVMNRLSEISNKMHNEGITDLNSHYYITKRFLQNFNETGKLSEEAVKFAITPRLIKAYEANFETGKAVTFLANHGTPNHELMVSKTFDMGFLGRNTGSMSAFNATFFAGSKETSVNYVGNPIAKTWVRDFIQARKYYVKNFSPELKAKLESLLSSDTSKGVVQKVSALMANAHIEFPDDFKLKDTGRKTKEGEPIIKPQPETQLGYDIDGFLDRALEGANDEGFSIGGYEMSWNEEGRKPYLLRNIVKMENPYVHEYAKADYRDETFASVIRRAKEAGHDGVIFKNTKDGGGLDTIFASFAKNEDNKIFTLETTEDTRFAPRGTDEAGNKVKGGSEIEGRNYQPTDEAEGNDYRGTHKAPSGENGEGSLDAMDRTYPEDLYSAQGARYYGSGDKTDKRMHELIMKFRGKPDAMVTVYRAVPKGVDASITKGDWVTPLREYAVLHGNRWEQGMTILEKKVKASELFTEGNSIYEFGWSPKEPTKADALRKEIADHEKFMERSRNNAPILWERKGTKIYAQREAMERRLSSLKYELKNIEQESNRPKFQPDEGRKYNKGQMDNQFIGRQAAERRDLIDGIRLAYRPWDKADGKDEGRKKIILTRSADGAEIGRIDFDYEHLTKYGLKSRGFGENEDGGIVVDGINVKVHEGFQGKGYQHILYSEMFERARALGVVGFNQSIENKKGLPLKSVNRVIGEADNFIASLVEPNPQRPTQENFDRLMAGAPSPTGNWMSNEPAVQNWGKLNKKAWYQPDEKLPPSRDQGFNRVYREISRSKKKTSGTIKQSYLDRFGIKLKDYEELVRLEDALYRLERDYGDGKIDDDSAREQRKDLTEEIEDRKNIIDSDIKDKMGYGVTFEDHNTEIESGLRSINRIIDIISKKPLDKVDELAGSNRLEAVLKKELGSGFAQEIVDEDVFVANAFREYAGIKYEREMIGAAFESELYSSEYITPQKGRHHYTIPASEGANKKGILVDILRSENKLTDKGLPQGEVNPRRIINALRNKSGGDSKVYAEAKAIGLIDWLESKQEGKNQKKVTTKELIEFVENNKMGLEIDPQLEQNADFGDTRPYVTGGEEQAKKGYRVYVVRMTNANHEHGVEGHFNGAVVHVRVTLRDTKDGKKVMHIEEIQANNTATGVLSDAQRKIVKEEVGLFEQLKRKKEKILDERHDNQMAVDSDDTLTSAEKLDTKLQMRERSRKEIDALHAEYAEKIFQANREEWKDIYAHQPQRDDAGYIKLIKSSLEARGVDIFISERETKLNAKKSDAPLQDPKEWVKVAFRTVLRKALVEGVDRITITPWSETPLQVGMKAKSAERFYGKTIVDAFNSELQKMNSRLNVENKSTSNRQARMTEANVRLNDAIQRVAKEVDVRAENNGADIAEIFKYLHMSDADLDNRFVSQSNNYLSSAYNFEKWMGFELAKLPNDYKGLDAIEKAASARSEKLRAYVEEEMSNQGAKTPSGRYVAAGSMSESQYLVDRSMGFDLTPEMKKKAAKPQRMFLPSEYTEFKSEQSATGRILRNAKGYVIMLANNKFRVYNPAKAIIGVYGSEEEAKKRIYREIPKQ